MTRRQNRAFVAGKLPTKIPEMLIVIRLIIERSRNNKAVPGAGPYLDALEQAADALWEAEVRTRSRMKGTAAARDVSLGGVRKAVTAFKGFVQARADKADPLDAETIITSCGLNVRAPSTRRKAPFTAKPGDKSGTVVVEVTAPAKRALYMWSCSVDGGRTFDIARRTKQSKARITGLPIGQYVAFRFKVVTKDGEGDWNDAIIVLVK
jgi:hypothetical protein